MIPPDTLLYIYEVKGDVDEPSSFLQGFVGIWNEDDFSYVFFTEAADEEARLMIDASGASLNARHEIMYRDWQSGLPPEGLNVKGLTFAPPGVRPDRHVVALDPSVVFGDGAHPTTIACLEEIHEIMRTQEITRALDLGCGTGILSLAVAGWGAAHVCAVDKNRLAVRTTKANVILNGREDTIEVIEGEARAHIVEPYDLVAANLPFSILRDLLQTQSAGIHRFWVVSGINETQSAVLQELFRDLGYTILGERSSAPWTTFTAKKEFGSTQ